jgi:hypothetical protein
MSSEETQNTAAGAAATPGQEAYEEEHVHSVYEQIASHFSSTRYKVGIVHVNILHSSNPSQKIFLKADFQETNKMKKKVQSNPSPAIFSLKVVFIQNKSKTI